MLKLALAASALFVLCACGTQMGDRMASGAAIGAGTRRDRRRRARGSRRDRRRWRRCVDAA